MKLRIAFDKNLGLPYDSDFFKKLDEDAELTPEDIQSIRQDDEKYLKDKSIKYNETEINGFIEDLNIQFETFILLFNNININKCNIPYYFESENVSHYGTDTAIKRFENYKKNGAIMKAKYLNKESTPKEFEKWILDYKK